MGVHSRKNNIYWDEAENNLRHAPLPSLTMNLDLTDPKKSPKNPAFMDKNKLPAGMTQQRNASMIGV